MSKRDDKAEDSPTGDDFRRELKKSFNQAEKNQFPLLDITAGQLHRAVGGYPKYLTLCCEVMRAEMAPSDRVLYEPRVGLHGSLTIRYFLPRTKE
jgi:hypothetical protein